MSNDLPQEDDILHLKQLIEELKEELETTSSERDRALIEARLSAVDAEAAKSFSKQNYTTLLHELFEEPSKKLRKYNQAVIALSVITLVSLSASFFLIYNKSLENTALERKIDALASKLSDNDQVIVDMIDSNNKNSSNIQNLLSDTHKEINSIQKNINANNQTEKPTHSANQRKEVTEEKITKDKKDADENYLKIVEEQKNIILDYIKSAETQKGFPKKYRTEKQHLAQLYIIVMQHAMNDNIYYDSFLATMEELDISPAIKPKNSDELATFDQDFLYASYAAYTITSHKRKRAFRYRDIDRQFSTYYNSNNGYDLGAWQIVNKTKDYSTLPKIFSLNIMRIAQQLTFNNKESLLAFPSTLFYRAYNETPKNNSIANLLGGATVIAEGSTLKINTQTMEIYSNTALITQVQTALADNNLMDRNIINGLLGPKTRGAIAEYRNSNNLEKGKTIDLQLLESMGIETTITALSQEG